MTESTSPHQIGPYAIEQRLGAGGMGTVYLGRHQVSGEVAAVKVLSASLARETGVTERFLREIETMRQLGGPHIVKLFDSGTDLGTDQLYYAMEYVEGPNLADLIRARRRIPWDEAIAMSLQVCSALKVAHAAGVVHRDLKPSNLLVGIDGTIKLTDFGVAQVFASNRLTVTGGVIGTAEYMSPEQSLGQRATKKSDLYSLGAVLYVMLTGRPPFTGKTSLDVMRKHATARFDLPSLYENDIPRLLEEIVCKLLEKNPDDRYPDAHIVTLRLKEVVKRIEFANRDELTLFRDDGEPQGATAIASAAGSALAETRAMPAGPGPATIVRDLFHLEMEREKHKSPLARFFDQTPVLVGTLVVLIGGLIWWWQTIKPNTQSTDDNAGMVTDEFAVEAEVDRFWRLARSYRRTGDTAREERLLRALRTLVSADQNSEQLLPPIDERLEQLQEFRRKQSQDYRLARAAIVRARELMDDGQSEAARGQLRGILELYELDPGAEDIVSEARQMLARTADEASERHEGEEVR